MERPGTAGKIAVMAARAAVGTCLNHRGDAKEMSKRDEQMEALIAEYRAQCRYYLTLRAKAGYRMRAYDDILRLGQELEALGIDPAPLSLAAKKELKNT